MWIEWEFKQQRGFYINQLINIPLSNQYKLLIVYCVGIPQFALYIEGIQSEHGIHHYYIILLFLELGLFYTQRNHAANAITVSCVRCVTFTPSSLLYSV